MISFRYNQSDTERAGRTMTLTKPALRSSLVSWRDTQAPGQGQGSQGLGQGSQGLGQGQLAIWRGAQAPAQPRATQAATRMQCSRCRRARRGCGPPCTGGSPPPCTPPSPSSSAQVELRQLQAQPDLLASTEAFKACERELSIAQRELQKVLEEYRAALGLYHRTARRPPA